MTQGLRVSEKGDSTKIAYPKSLRLEMEIENIRKKFGEDSRKKIYFNFCFSSQLTGNFKASEVYHIKGCKSRKRLTAPRF